MMTKQKRDSMYAAWDSNKYGKYEPSYIIIHLYLDSSYYCDGVKQYMNFTFEDTQEEIESALMKNHGQTVEIYTTQTSFFSWDYADELVLHHGGEQIRLTDKEVSLWEQLLGSSMKGSPS